MEELKTRSFRVSEEVSNKLKAVCADFDNQNSALDALIKAYEIQLAKSIIVDRKTELSDLDTHLQAIQTAFLRSLELNENAEHRVRAEFRNLLDSKDEMIMQLQADNAQLQEQAVQSETAYSDLQTTTDGQITAVKEELADKEKNAQNAVERMNEAIKAREQAEKISAMTSETVEQLKLQLAEMTSKAEQSDDYKNKLELSGKQLVEMQHKINVMENERVQSEGRYKHDMEVAVKSAIADIREAYQEKIEQSQVTVSQLQTKIEQSQATVSQLQTKIEQLLDEISNLKKQVLVHTTKKN